MGRDGINPALFSSKSTEWATPQSLVDELSREFGRFSLDPCATSETAKAEIHYSDHGLELPWFGIVFLNPPYGHTIGQWIEKAYKESRLGSTIVCLLPSRTDTRWWHDYVMKADEIRFIKGRLKFSGHKNSAPFPSCIVVFRGRNG